MTEAAASAHTQAQTSAAQTRRAAGHGRTHDGPMQAAPGIADGAPAGFLALLALTLNAQGAEGAGTAGLTEAQLAQLTINDNGEIEGDEAALAAVLPFLIPSAQDTAGTPGQHTLSAALKGQGAQQNALPAGLSPMAQGGPQGPLVPTGEQTAAARPLPTGLAQQGTAPTNAIDPTGRSAIESQTQNAALAVDPSLRNASGERLRPSTVADFLGQIENGELPAKPRGGAAAETGLVPLPDAATARARDGLGPVPLSLWDEDILFGSTSASALAQSLSGGTQGASGSGQITGLGAAPTPAAAQAPAGAQGQAGAHAATQILAITMQKAAEGGQSRSFTLQMDPPELGRVEVQMRFGKDKTLKAVLLVEKPETYLLLQRDAQVLERSLQGTGLDTGGGLEFSLAKDGERFSGGQAGPGARGPGTGGDAAEAEAVGAAQALAAEQISLEPGRYSVVV